MWKWKYGICWEISISWVHYIWEKEKMVNYCYERPKFDFFSLFTRCAPVYGAYALCYQCEMIALSDMLMLHGCLSQICHLNVSVPVHDNGELMNGWSLLLCGTQIISLWFSNADSISLFFYAREKRKRLECLCHFSATLYMSNDDDVTIFNNSSLCVYLRTCISHIIMMMHHMRCSSAHFIQIYSFFFIHYHKLNMYNYYNLDVFVLMNQEEWNTHM